MSTIDYGRIGLGLPGQARHLGQADEQSGRDAGFSLGSHKKDGAQTALGERDLSGNGSDLRERHSRFASSLKSHLEGQGAAAPSGDGDTTPGERILARIHPKGDDGNGGSAEGDAPALPIQLTLMNPEGDGMLMTVKMHAEPPALSGDHAERVARVAKLVGDQLDAHLRANLPGQFKDGVRFDIKVQDPNMALAGISVHARGDVVTVGMRLVEGVIDPQTMNALAASLAQSLADRFPRKTIEIAGLPVPGDPDRRRDQNDRKGGDDLAAIFGKR